MGTIMPLSFFQCSECGQCFEPEQVTYNCLTCGGNLDAHFSFEKNPDEINQSAILESGEASIWRYAPLLAAPDPGFKNTPLHQVGLTPVYQPESLRKSLGMQKLWIKDESRNPSASFKDRASALVIARAIESDIQTIIAASTGNAGAALACMAASIGKQAVIIAPRSAPPAKVAQLLTFGARVVLVGGNIYGKAFDLSIGASREFGWYNCLPAAVIHAGSHSDLVPKIAGKNNWTHAFILLGKFADTLRGTIRAAVIHQDQLPFLAGLVHDLADPGEKQGQVLEFIENRGNDGENWFRHEAPL